MNRRKLIPGLLLALVLLAAASGALAMRSANYHLDWYERLTGSGGPRMSSAHYKAYATVGQVGFARGLSSATFRAQLGYWAGIHESYRVMLPLVLREF